MSSGKTFRQTLLRASFPDIELFCDSVREWNLELAPIRATGATQNVAQLVQFQLDDVDHSYARLRAPLLQAGDAPEGKYTFILPGPDMGPIWWRGQLVPAGQILVYRTGSEVAAISGADFDVHALSLTEERIAGIGDALDLDRPKPELLPEVFAVPAAFLSRWRTALRGLSEATGNVPAQAYDWITEEIVAAWFGSAGRSPSSTKIAKTNRLRALRTCLELVEATGPSTLTVAKLRQHAGVGARTLEYVFRDRFGVGPAAFVKGVRLSAAHRLLTEAEPGTTTVGTVMAETGFYHVGQFARDFRQLFGRLPSEVQADTARPGK